MVIDSNAANGRSAVFLQARLASSRLPDKALLELAGKPVITHAMEALRGVAADDHVLLTDAASAPRLEPLADAAGFTTFVGDPTDVLARFVAALDAYPAERVVRATGDNPLVSVPLARRALALQIAHAADYAGILASPFGTGVEVLRSAALRDLAGWSRFKRHREHVGPGLLERPQRYRVVRVQAHETFRQPDLRVTLDTIEDYRYLVAIFDALYAGRPIDTREVIQYARDRHRRTA